jgi:cytochrome c553
MAPDDGKVIADEEISDRSGVTGMWFCSSCHGEQDNRDDLGRGAAGIERYVRHRLGHRYGKWL